VECHPYIKPEPNNYMKSSKSYKSSKEKMTNLKKPFKLKGRNTRKI